MRSAAREQASEPLGEIKARIDVDSQAALSAFLASRDRVTFSTSQRPLVSVVVVLFNRAELTLAMPSKPREAACGS